jgi:hypothetical protein
MGARAAGGAEMLADLPLGELANARWRLELTLPAAGGGKRVPLPPVLEASANSGTVVTSLAAAAADPAAKAGTGAETGAMGPGRPGPAARPARRSVLRRAAGRIRRALRNRSLKNLTLKNRP